ncbi:MAG TPA: hypothetical protein VFE02_11885 [Candidatus Acidoferrales bacterium]|nr:hypothetical protein [Candidatus Acidoferrales bacterium]
MHLLDSIIAFAAVMLAASLVVTAGTQLIISVLGLRGANLRRSLSDLFENACDDRDAKRYGKVIARRALHHPLLTGSAFSRFGVRAGHLPFLPADAAGKLRWAGSGIPFQPWLLGAASGFFLCPAAIAIINRLTPLDISAVSNLINGVVPLLNFVEHPWRTGAIVGAIFGGLLSRWRLATSVRPDELVGVLEKLSSPPGGSLPDPAQRAMLVIAGEAQSAPRLKMDAAALEFDKFIRELPEHNEDAMLPASEKNQKPAAPQLESRLEGVNSWFDHVMTRASQRFTLQARVITVAVSFVLVFGAHFDVIRIFHSLASDAEVRAQIAESTDALLKQAAQLSHSREDGSGKEIVPDVYRKAMVDVLQSTPVSVEPVKPKSHHSSHHSSSSAAAASQAAANGASAESPDGVQAGAQPPAEDAAASAAAQLASDAPVKESKHRSSKSSSKAKTPAPVEAVKAPAAPMPGEDIATMQAKAAAGKALITTAGFASRQDAVAWLRGTLNSNPATDNLVANYEHAVNAQLVSDTDRLLDHSASMRYDFGRSELALVPEKWIGWKPAGTEWPGLLVAVALLSLCAPICFNLLKTVASLRPIAFTGASYYPERRVRKEDRRQTPQRELSKIQLKAQPKAQEKPLEKATLKIPEKMSEKQEDDRKPVTAGHIDDLL